MAKLISINGVTLALKNIVSTNVRKSYVYWNNPWILEVQYKQMHEEVNIVGPFVKTDKKDIRNYRFKFDTVEMAQYYKGRADGTSK